MRAPLLALMLVTAPAIAWECREGLRHEVYDEFGRFLDSPVPVATHFELASDVLFGRAVSAWLEKGRVFVSFEIFEALKGEKSGTVVIENYGEIGPSMHVGLSYVATVFDGDQLDLCSLLFEMPSSINNMNKLAGHAQRTDYDTNYTRLRELLKVAEASH